MKASRQDDARENPDPAHDAWFQWVTSRRDGGSDAQRQRALRRLAPVRDAILDHAAVAPGQTLLDVGAGDGLIAFSALDRVGETGMVIFSDVSTDLLAHCEALADKLGLADRCRFVAAPADDLAPFGHSSVDVVTTRSVLIYVTDKAAAFREFHRVLRPGGRASIYEPINRLMNDATRLWSYDMSPVAELFDKVEAFYNSIQDPDTCPMLDFDERDLLACAEGAGFEQVHLRLHVDVEPERDPVPWETFVSTSGNPLVPTIHEAIDQALSKTEAAQFEAHLRPLVEQAVGRRRLVGAYLWATKREAQPAPPSA